MGQLHDDSYDERCSEGRAANELGHRDGRLSLLRPLLGLHLFDIFFNLVGGAKPSQRFAGLFLPSPRNEQISISKKTFSIFVVVLFKNIL